MQETIYKVFLDRSFRHLKTDTPKIQIKECEVRKVTPKMYYISERFGSQPHQALARQIKKTEIGKFKYDVRFITEDDAIIYVLNKEDIPSAKKLLIDTLTPLAEEHLRMAKMYVEALREGDSV